MVTYDSLNYYTRHMDHWNSLLFYEKMLGVSKYDQRDAQEYGAMEVRTRMWRLELWVKWLVMVCGRDHVYVVI